ncbi:MAG: 2-keto-4-pentenoate hydratase [Minwuia sp.]|uniref:2-keto-4-pentenoate hydratase n=1 Tax=Minwuia sp. TaxID=2493630 RepID=UPI003A83DFDC
MTTTEIADQAATWLDNQHLEGAAFEPLPDRFRPADLAGAYRIQQALVARLRQRGRPSFGWKIALTATTMQQMVGIDRPVGGMIAAPQLHDSPADLPAADYGRICFECEVALRLNRDLTQRGAPFLDEAIRDSVDGVAAAFEVADDRNADYSRLDAFSLIADNAWNAGMVLGEVHGPETLDGLADATALLEIDGAEAGRGVGRDALGHPLQGLRVLADEMTAQGCVLRAGDWVLTGTVIRTQFPSVGQTLVYRHSLLGEVRATVN